MLRDLQDDFLFNCKASIKIENSLKKKAQNSLQRLTSLV